MEKIIGFVIILLLSLLVIFDTGEIEMKKITSFIIVLFLAMVAVFAVPKPIDVYMENGYCRIFWQLESIPEDSDIVVATTTDSAMDILDVNDNGKITNKFYKINITNPEVIYLIEKYEYVIIAAPNERPVLETKLDWGYVAFDLDLELE